VAVSTPWRGYFRRVGVGHGHIAVVAVCSRSGY
jgi:hypothetical protein